MYVRDATAMSFAQPSIGKINTKSSQYRACGSDLVHFIFQVALSSSNPIYIRKNQNISPRPLFVVDNGEAVREGKGNARQLRLERIELEDETDRTEQPI